ncbi:MAG: hypothetical protein A2085_02325 [Gemmatimonadetes bacterium GWC2_71_10]|nr:MAG: hypothetical protein A2085_02325 [Gemmatimonadetes bacterium GWC2_71_10]
MNGVPAWVGPTMAISLVVIATSFLVMGAVVLALGVGIRNKVKAVRAQLATYNSELKTLTGRLRTEIDGYASLSAEARGKLRGAIDTVDSRLKDLDALVEVLQVEAEETALDAAAFLRTVRRSGRILSAARGLARRRRG